MGYCLLGATHNEASAEYLFAACSRYKGIGDEAARDKLLGWKQAFLRP